MQQRQRPATSKARGLCRYYDTPGGCFAGDRCKFLHGPDAKLTPFDKAKVCKYYERGFCKNGDGCWFLHGTAGPAPQRVEEEEEDFCSICFEMPSLFGLLDGCSHVFCISCIRQWRDSHTPALDGPGGMHKRCPMCRATSKFVTPSSRFVREGDPEKDRLVAEYMGSMARVPCKYMQTQRRGAPRCPFGNQCFYQHPGPSAPGIARTTPARPTNQPGPTNQPQAAAPIEPQSYPLVQRYLNSVIDALRETLAIQEGTQNAEANSSLNHARSRVSELSRPRQGREEQIAGLAELEAGLGTSSERELDIFALVLESIRQMTETRHVPPPLPVGGGAEAGGAAAGSDGEIAQEIDAEEREGADSSSAAGDSDYMSALDDGSPGNAHPALPSVHRGQLPALSSAQRHQMLSSVVAEHEAQRSSSSSAVSRPVQTQTDAQAVQARTDVSPVQVQTESPRPPFVTDGRGRVIGAHREPGMSQGQGQQNAQGQ